MRHFHAKQGTHFTFREDLQQTVIIHVKVELLPQTKGSQSIVVPVDDLIEFACHIGKDYSAALAGREVSGFLRGLFR
jgi:hypothetical protein